MATMDEYFKKGEVYKNQSGSTVKIDWYDKNGEVQYTHNKQSQSATEKGLKNMLERNGYKKVNDIAMEYDPIACMMVPAKDQRTVDDSGFNSIVKYFHKECEDAFKKATPENAEELFMNLSKKHMSAINDMNNTFNSISKDLTQARNDINHELSIANTKLFAIHNKR